MSVGAIFVNLYFTR